MVTLSSCRVDTVVRLEVDRDGTGVVTVEAVADAAVVSAAPGLADDLRFDDAIANGWTVEGPTPTDDGGLRVVLSRPFTSLDEATILLASVSGQNGPLKGIQLTRVGGVDAAGAPDGSNSTITMVGSLDNAAGVSAYADPDVLAAVGAAPYADDIVAAGVAPTDVITVRFDVSVPGSVSEGGVGAEQRDGVLSWTAPTSGTPVDVRTVFTVDAGGGFWSTIATAALVVLIVWVIVAIAFITFVVRARKQRQQSATRRRGAPTARRR